MPQVKKPWVRDAILAAALRLFQRHSFPDTTLGAIAREAGVSSANLYVYFGSKLEILYAVYEPWMRTRLTLLERKLARVADPFERIRLILRTLWREIPAEQNGFVRNIVQALVTAEAGAKYDPSLLHWMEERIDAMLIAALPRTRRRIVQESGVARMLVMALDGYAIHYHLHASAIADDRTIDAMAMLLFGKPALEVEPRARVVARRRRGPEASASIRSR